MKAWKKRKEETEGEGRETEIKRREECKNVYNGEEEEEKTFARLLRKSLLLWAN